ncbi:MAG: hypothetical protein PWQ12_1847 [Clostridiales bacterium]|jgi:hypothetical protein|nr:hypothetical protein [Clostridiales bacterium]
MKSLHQFCKAIRAGLSQMNTLWHEDRGEFALNTVIGIAIGLIVAAFVLIPSIQDFATMVMTDMDNWWTNAVGSQIFPN